MTLQLAWWGTIVTVLVAWLLARLLPTRPIREIGRTLVTWLSKPSAAIYAVALAGIGALCSASGSALRSVFRKTPFSS